ncbi:MAG: alpha/beta fold hydrolase [Myxococcota bacterium]
MERWGRRLAFGIGVVLLLVVGLALLLRWAPGMMGLEMKPEDANQWFEAQGLPVPEWGTAAGPERNVGFVRAGRRGGPLVLFIHGSPGGWSAWQGYLAHPELRQMDLVAVDRPGYGRSGAGRVLPSVDGQAQHIAAVLEMVAAGRRAVVVGHSLGGPIAGRLAMLFPDLVKGLLLIAPSVDPELEETKWFQRLALWPGVRALVPPDLEVCNLEILPLETQLESIEPGWAKLRVPTVVLQGTVDTLVPPGNGAFIEARLPGADVIFLEGVDHFIPWSKPELVRRHVRALALGDGG